jgi:hypothetical protein
LTRRTAAAEGEQLRPSLGVAKSDERLQFTDMQVFISHSSKDTRLAKQLADRLAQAGFEAWLPETKIFPGDNWASAIGNALEDSDLMVVLVTPQAFQSDWLKAEVQYAFTADHFKGRILPVFVGSDTMTPPDVPWILRKMEPVEIAGSGEDWEQVVDRVKTLAG